MYYNSSKISICDPVYLGQLLRFLHIMQKPFDLRKFFNQMKLILITKQYLITPL